MRFSWYCQVSGLRLMMRVMAIDCMCAEAAAAERSLDSPWKKYTSGTEPPTASATRMATPNSWLRTERWDMVSSP